MSIVESSEMTIVASKVMVSQSFFGPVWSSVGGNGSVPDKSEVLDVDVDGP